MQPSARGTAGRFVGRSGDSVVGPRGDFGDGEKRAWLRTRTLRERRASAIAWPEELLSGRGLRQSEVLSVERFAPGHQRGRGRASWSFDGNVVYIPWN